MIGRLRRTVSMRLHSLISHAKFNIPTQTSRSRNSALIPQLCTTQEHYQNSVTNYDPSPQQDATDLWFYFGQGENIFYGL